MSVRLQGVAAAPGLALGRAALWHPRAGHGPEAPGDGAAPGDPEQAMARYREAARHVRAELESLQQVVAGRAGTEAAAILGAQALMAEDPELAAEVERLLRHGTPLARAVREAGEAMAALLDALQDPYLRQRAADVRDVTGRIAAALAGGEEAPPAPYEDTVLIAPEIPPSAVARLDVGRVRAIVTAGGGATSHAALLAKGLGIPAVMGCSGVLEAATEGDAVAVDGDAGSVLVRPEPAEEEAFRRRVARAAEEAAGLARLRDLPAVTAYGRKVMLAANLARAAEARAALEAGAEGVGLFRTEFLFLDRPDLPGEEEQFAEYRAVAEAMAPRPVVIRTLDIGGDKFLPALPLPREENPFLGWRGIRLWLDREDLAVPQIRALLRAARHGEVHILLPMVADVSEVRRARALIERVRAGLGEAAGPYKLGIMVEVPAAALAADRLAAEAEFFSIGTNDLVQYTLAADRGNPKVAALSDPLHPAVLRLIDMTVRAAHARGIPVAVCGDAAGDPRVIPALVALGVDELSMPPAAIPAAKRQVRSLTEADVQAAIRGL
ncbi:phosphoenolpyruvate--protein phosphotransferase [Caldinitratiruptor microaerophilus]|uniref:Phosphoenolpyruvate-protein phosphotransferase n=1 Tax=Caldinitratiruptor microaerophilus TaxID=671077 RepID=A0AA35CID6_9FIRM|nr:phosphoenolpyruvate--protein phosphotransferase [Caldinitratiruptor microaerophilus]BDG59684.1 hypothetical protein caldi_07740 [Caldinitratiruptor microaerophilus]